MHNPSAIAELWGVSAIFTTLMNDQVMRNYAYFAQSGLKTKVLNSFRSVFRIGPLEQALRHRTIGRSSSSLWGRLIPPEYTYPKDSWRAVEWNGLKLKLDLSNANDHGAYFALQGTVDATLMAHVKVGDTVIDIGGNIGIYALTLAQRVMGREGKGREGKGREGHHLRAGSEELRTAQRAPCA